MRLTNISVIFVRTRAPIDPVDLVIRICEETRRTGTKRSRYAQRLTPVTLTATANMEGLLRLCDEVLQKAFHGEEHKAYKVWLIQVDTHMISFPFPRYKNARSETNAYSLLSDLP